MGKLHPPHPNRHLPLEKIATEADISPPRGNPFPVVGIGASAGGLEAFGQLLSALPPDTGMAFVLVQHLDPLHESFLPELLASHTTMPVVTVHDDLAIAPNHVYVIPPNTSMELQDGALRLAAREPGLHLPIDIFFRSLARVQGSRAIGVVLSGNASDGSVGVRAIKSECGITFAQNEATARFGGMPRNAVATGAIDYVLAPADIARELGTLAAHPYLIPSRPGDALTETLPEGDGELRRIFALLRNAMKVDFSRYKPTTVRRRIGRRMMVLRSETLKDYARHVEQYPAELRELYRDLLISVTSFFRDPDSFEALRSLLVEGLDSDRRNDDPFRIWVSGCATGEEVYSLAISVFEVLQEKRLQIPMQLFGTDISDIALERARHATYPIGIEDDVPPERLRRFFTKVDSGYQISKVIRESCVFARHDVTKDPPFSNLDLVSCRNLLIYLDQNAQRHVLPVFHYALKASGLLMLGSAESTAAAADLFVPVEQQHKIYKRKAVPPRLPLDMSLGGTHLDNSIHSAAGSGAIELQKRLERLIQSKYSPDAVLINSEFQIIQFRGHTSHYLDPSPAQASLNVLRMASETLVLPLRRAVQTAAETNAIVIEPGIELDIAGQPEVITLEVTPLPGLETGERFFLIVFVRERVNKILSAEHLPSALLPVDENVAKVQRELAETREHLRNLTEQYEAHSEELRAVNEEARSANEELQSTNEELRTTKEELQSANEELTTVNEELQSRNSELNATNSDLKNLLSAITIPILMVDSDLRVRRFNSAAATLLELGPMDIGRPVGHLRGRIETPRLEQQVKNVIDTLHAIFEELQDSQGCWYSLNIRPYRTVDDRIAGAVITLQDIDPLKRGLQAAEEARDYAEGMIETVREPLVVLDADLRVQRATRAFYDMFLVSREETQGRFLHDLGNGQWNLPRLRELIGAALFRSEPFHDFEVDHDFPHVGRRTKRLNGRRIPFPHSPQRMLLLSIEDVTERREIAEIRFQRLFETAKDGIVVIDVETQTVQDVNPFLLELTGYSREDLVGKTITEAGKRLGLPEISLSIEATRKSQVVRYDDLELVKGDGKTVAVEMIGNCYKVGSQPVIQFNIRDVTMRKEQDEQLRKSLMEKDTLVREIHHRVKNNLQVIASLLSLQSRYTNDQHVLAAFEEAESRLRAIAHIHERLHASDDLTEVEFASYITGLAKELVQLHSDSPDRISLDLDLADMVLHIEQAVPLGLIANELILNSLKHGLRGRTGAVQIRLAYVPGSDQSGEAATLDGGGAELEVADTGPGLPPDLDVSTTNSLGLRLVNLLVRQLRGRLETGNAPGARLRVKFPLRGSHASNDGASW